MWYLILGMVRIGEESCFIICLISNLSSEVSEFRALISRSIYLSSIDLEGMLESMEISGSIPYFHGLLVL